VRDSWHANYSDSDHHSVSYATSRTGSFGHSGWLLPWLPWRKHWKTVKLNYYCSSSVADSFIVGEFSRGLFCYSASCELFGLLLIG